MASREICHFSFCPLSPEFSKFAFMKNRGLSLRLPTDGRVLVHACCAPCSSAILECLVRHGIRPVVFYSNSNIFPYAEYEKRRNECVRYAGELGLEIIDDVYDHDDWRCIARGLEREPERGARCLECFRYRLVRAAKFANDNGFAVLTTTLASSRWKDLSQVNEAGEYACSLFPNVVWWEMNWRKGGLQERRNQIIKEREFYNQLYCGCEYGLANSRKNVGTDTAGKACGYSECPLPDD